MTDAPSIRDLVQDNLSRPVRTDDGTANILRGLGMDDKLIEDMTPEERAILQTCLEEILDNGESPTAASLLLADYRWQPVSMEQFLDDPFYMGDLTKDLYPAVRGALIESFDLPVRPTELILGGSIGWGKTLMASLAMLYVLYRLTCLRDPHSYYKKVPGSKIYLAIYSVSIDQVEDSSYSKIMNWVDKCPYFLERSPRQKRITTKLVFPGSPIQLLVGSKEVHSIGRDVFAFMLDEANFLSSGDTSSKGPDRDRGLAYRIYANARNRLKSRFLATGGDIAGLVILSSSKRTRTSFLEEHIKESHDTISSGATKLVQFNQWEVQPASRFTMRRFRVEVGDRIHRSRILRDDEDPRIGADVLEVPGEFRGEFERDIDGALRDIAGVASDGILPLMQDKQAIIKCARATHVHPFTQESFSLSLADDLTADAYFVRERMFAVRRSSYVTRLNPQCARFLHVDIGLTGDALGLACLHLSGFRKVRRTRADGTWYEDTAPIAVVDFMVRIDPPEHSEVDLGKVRGFILNLRDMGLPIWRVTLDGFQSRDFVQILKKVGIDSAVYSVDKTDEAYMGLRQAVLEERLVYYNYPIFLREVSELERDLDNRKVDHPDKSPSTGMKGSKDVADAVCGAYFSAILDKRVAVPGVHMGEPGDNVDYAIKSHVGDVPWHELDKEARR